LSFEAIRQSGKVFLSHPLVQRLQQQPIAVGLGGFIGFDNFVIWVVFFMLLVYNKNVIVMHNNLNKSVKGYIYGTTDFE